MVNGPQEIILEHLRAIRANKGLKEGHRNLKAELIAVEKTPSCDARRYPSWADYRGYLARSRPYQNPPKPLRRPKDDPLHRFFTADEGTEPC